MKSLSRIMLAVAVLGMAFVACDKKEDEEVIPEASKTDLLTAHTWVVTDIKLQPIGLSIWDSVPDCEKDNSYKFEATGIGTFGYGTIKCDPSEPDSDNFLWMWKNNQNDIEIPDSTENLLITNVQITSNSMTGNTTYMEQGGQVNVKLFFSPK